MTPEIASDRTIDALPGKRSRAVVVLPCRATDVFTDSAAASWLQAASWHPQDPTLPLLERLLPLAGLPLPRAGRAALRLWGQTGERPRDWVAAADPVWMQAGMEKLFVHVPPPGEIGATELAALFNDLQAALFADRQMTLQASGEQGYVRGPASMTTATLPPSAIDGSRPDAFMPDIADAAARDYYALCSEIEMLLHQHRINVEREQRGQRPVNALWLWGGGKIRETEPRALPVVFASDPLLKGYCLYSEAACSAWPGTLAACVEQAPAGFVAVLPDMTDESLPAVAADLKSAWGSRNLRQLVMVFDDVLIDRRRGLRSWLRRGGMKQLRKHLGGD